TDLATKRTLNFPNAFEQCFVTGHDQRGADRGPAFGDRGPCELRADIAFQPHCFGKDEPAAMPHAPAVDKFTVPHGLAHGSAAEHNDFAEEERSAFGKIDINSPRN